MSKCFLVLVLLLAGCRTVVEPSAYSEGMKFRRLFSWNVPPNKEEGFERCAQAGVTDIVVHSKQQFEWAVKYGMTPYWRIFTPVGPHRQVMSPEEEKHYAYINGHDIDKMRPQAERMAEIHRRRREVNHRYGGEYEAEIDTINNAGIPCFLSDDGLALSKQKIDNLLKDVPQGAAGMFLDYFGYMNHHGCYCESCLKRYEEYLKEHGLEDSQKSKDEFFRQQLIGYYDGIIGYIKSKHPEFKIVAHFYPDFKPDHLIGNRTKVDYCGQTVAWYFRWPSAKIRKYTEYVIGHAKDYYPFAEGIPFVGLNTNAESSLGFKTPAELEAEFKEILAAGGRTLMICDGRCIVEPNYFEVFRKYCGKEE